MKGKFNTIKKSRKKSKDIDEKIEYLNKECQKTGLNEIMNTSGIYSRVEQEPNPLHAAFRNSSYDGQGLAFSGTDFSINTTPIGGLHYSPPHPVTGERRRAFSWFGIASGFGPVGANSDRQLMWYFRSDLPNGGRWVSLERTRGENPYWGIWISTFFGAETLVPYNSVDSNLPDDVKNKLDSLNINQYINPDDWKSPTNPVLFKNDLDDPGHLPINIPDISTQGFNYLKNKADEELLAGTYDLMKRGQVPFLTPDQVNKILVDPKFQKLLQDDPDLLPILQRMRASNPNVPDVPNLGVKPGDQIAFFGGNKNKNTPPPAPTKRTTKGTMDATKASTGMYPSMTPAIFLQKYGISHNQYLQLP